MVLFWLGNSLGEDFPHSSDSDGQASFPTFGPGLYENVEIARSHFPRSDQRIVVLICTRCEFLSRAHSAFPLPSVVR